MLEGLVEPPSFNLRNPVMVAKHVHATVLTALFRMLREKGLLEDDLDALQNAMRTCLPQQIKSFLFTPEGLVRPAPMTVGALADVINKHRASLMVAVQAAFQQGWPETDAEVVKPDAAARHHRSSSR
ncbi:MAG: hypothetical protein V5B30_16080 [Candidatus Accumulibacter delftensis]|jgi:hypothetical protein